MIDDLKDEFSEEKVISVNSKNDSDEKQIVINSLENADNEYRVIFAVDNGMQVGFWKLIPVHPEHYS